MKAVNGAQFCDRKEVKREAQGVEMWCVAVVEVENEL